MKAYSVRVPDALYAEIQQEARTRGLSMSAVARERITASFAASRASKRAREENLSKGPKAKRIRRR